MYILIIAYRKKRLFFFEYENNFEEKYSFKYKQLQKEYNHERALVLLIIY